MANTASRPARGRCYCCGCGLLALGLPVGLLVWLLRPAAQPPWPNPWREVPASQNVVSAAVQAVGRTTLPTALTERGASGASPAARQWVATHAALLNQLAAACDRPQCSWPAETGQSAKPETRHYAQMRAAARMLCLRARVRWHHGEEPGALADLQRVVACGSAAARRPDSLIGYLVAQAIETVGLRALLSELGQPSRDPQTTDPTTRWPLPPLRPRQREVLRELVRRYQREQVDEPAAVIAALQAEAYFEASGTAAAMGKYAAARLGDHRLKLVRAAIQAAPLPPAKRPPPNTRPSLWDPAGSLATTYWRTIEKADSRRALRPMVACALALRLYVDDHHRLPARLNDLVTAGLLTTVPSDPFDGQPLRYLPRQGLLYLVGPDRVDAAGRRGNGCDDQPLLLPFVVPAPQ